MSGEHRDLVEDADTTLVSLFPCSRNAHNDVPENAPRERRERTFSHRKRQDIGRAIFMPIDFVQFVDVGIVS